MESHPSYRDQLAAELFGTTSRAFESYFKVFDGLMSYNDSYVLQIEDIGPRNPAPITHEDIIAATKLLRDDPALTLDQACECLKEALHPRYYPNQQLKSAIIIAVRVMLMIDCDGSRDAWKPHERFVDHVENRFPKTLGILFHFDDHRSSRILERLITKDGFDQDCARPEGYKMFADPKELEYLYWGERLATLHAFVHDRPPRNKFERWITWQSSESNAFAIALFALLISIIVGLLSLGLAGVQTWIAYKAWKEPVNVGGG
ncbi:hypothetical protein PG985_014306 [Apiospora marii]|uniref:uncharacterized protein n=1 Tax=Apiospora marii TaxID=335849 RepID=UPI00312FC9B0